MAFKRGSGHITVYALPEASEALSDGSEPEPTLWRFSSGLHCPDSHRRYSAPTPGMFSFNSAAGACPTCRGFGRVIGVDWGLVIPDGRKTLRNGAVKTIQTPAWAEIQTDLIKYAGDEGIPRDTAWSQMTAEHKQWVIHGDPNYKGNWNKQPPDRGGTQPAAFGHLRPRPVRGVLRGLLQRGHHHRLHPISGDRRRPPRARLVTQPVHAVLDEPAPPLADRRCRHPQILGDILVGQTIRARQHDPRPQRQRLRRLRPTRPPRQLGTLVIGQRQLGLRPPGPRHTPV